MMKGVVKAVALAAAVSALAGCSSYQQRSQMEAFNTSWVLGDYNAAIESMRPKPGLGGLKKVEDKRLLEVLHQAEAKRMLGAHDEAIALYDEAEVGMKLDDTTGLASNLLEGGMSVLVNDAERDYTPMLSETILVNTYKGLSFLHQGQRDLARIEFNRADDRTRRAVESFADEIAAQQAALKDGDGTEQASISKSLESDALQQSVSEHYGNTAQWNVYSEFIVPASTYLHGLFFLASRDSGDLDKASVSLSRVAEMAPDNTILRQDAELADALSSGRQSRQDLAPQVWVLYENGLGPVAKETRFDIPLLLFHGNTSVPAYTGIALPRYSDRAANRDALSINADGSQFTLEAFSPMGKVVNTEMQSRFPAVLGRAVASAAVKALIQKSAADELGAVGQLGSALFAASTTRADLRSWQATPDHWEATRFDRPASGALTLSTQAGPLGEVSLPDWPYTLVYIKRPSQQGPAQVSVIDLQGEHTGAQFTLGATPAVASR
ncbi:COG3014 family protein [Vreelandella salicampi]|nr:hypothetical protein [Halomonas salicampi]